MVGILRQNYRGLQQESLNSGQNNGANGQRDFKTGSEGPEFEAQQVKIQRKQREKNLRS
jgi:hypothetical protein